MSKRRKRIETRGNREFCAETSGITETEITPIRDHKDPANEISRPGSLSSSRARSITHPAPRAGLRSGLVPGYESMAESRTLTSPYPISLRPPEHPDLQNTRTPHPRPRHGQHLRHGRPHRHEMSPVRASHHYLYFYIPRLRVAMSHGQGRPVMTTPGFSSLIAGSPAATMDPEIGP